MSSPLKLPEFITNAFTKKGLLPHTQVAKLLCMDKKTLSKHVEQGHIGYINTGIGTKKPRRSYSLDDVQAFYFNHLHNSCNPCQNQNTESENAANHNTTLSSSNIIKLRIEAQQGAKGKATLSATSLI